MRDSIPNEGGVKTSSYTLGKLTKHKLSMRNKTEPVSRRGKDLKPRQRRSYKQLDGGSIDFHFCPYDGCDRKYVGPYGPFNLFVHIKNKHAIQLANETAGLAQAPAGDHPAHKMAIEHIQKRVTKSKDDKKVEKKKKKGGKKEVTKTISKAKAAKLAKKEKEAQIVERVLASVAEKVTEVKMVEEAKKAPEAEQKPKQNSFLDVCRENPSMASSICADDALTDGYLTDGLEGYESPACCSDTFFDSVPASPESFKDEDMAGGCTFDDDICVGLDNAFSSNSGSAINHELFLLQDPDFESPCDSPCYSHVPMPEMLCV